MIGTFSYAWLTEDVYKDWLVCNKAQMRSLQPLSFFKIVVCQLLQCLLVVIVKIPSFVTVIILDPCLELCHAGNLSWAWKVSRWLFFSAALVK